MSPYGSVRKLTILITFPLGRFDGTQKPAGLCLFKTPLVAVGGFSIFDGYLAVYLTGMDFLCGTGTALMLF